MNLWRLKKLKIKHNEDTQETAIKFICKTCGELVVLSMASQTFNELLEAYPLKHISLPDSTKELLRKGVCEKC